MYHQKILFLAYDLVGNYEDAKDIAQDAFIRAFEKIRWFEERSKFSTWLYRITVNLGTDFHRKRQRSVRTLRDTHMQSWPHNDVPSESASGPVEAAEIRDQLEAALDRLSMNQRTATALKYFHQKTTREIADIMECSQSTVRNHIFRAMSSLKKQLGEPL